MKRTSQAAGAALIALAAGTAAASAQTISNGSFNQWVAGDTGTHTWSELGVANAGLTPTLQNWTTPAGGVECVILSGNPTSYATAGTSATPMCGTAYGNGSAPSLPTPAPTYGMLWATPGTLPVTGYTGNILAADGDAAFNGPIEETVSGLTPGAKYTLSFYQSAGQQAGWTGALNDIWQVTFGNTINAATMVVASKGTVPWALQTLTFQATSASQVLSFLATSNDTGSNEPPLLLLADVTLTKAPEPATIALLGVGLLGLVKARRRARRPTASA